MDLTTSSEWRVVHYNFMQRRSALIRANFEVLIAARGTGKTRGVIGPRMIHNALAMPRSLNGFVIPSWKKFASQFISSLYPALSVLGYEEGRDYTIGQRGPKHWPQPHNKIKDWGYAMHFSCGSAYSFISQDVAGAGNGLNLDSAILEEAKLLNEDRWNNDTFPAIRGNNQHFGDQSEHGSILMVSDRPTTRQGRWLYSYKELMDPERVKMILQVQYQKLQLFEAIQSGKLSPSSVLSYESRIRTIDANLNDARKDLVYYHEASVLDNAHVFGIDKVINMSRTMPDLVFRTSMLNEDVNFVEGGWYIDFDEDVHTYTPQLSSWTLERGFDASRIAEQSSRHDAEIDRDARLEIGMDYGARINCLVVGQLYEDVLRVDKDFHVITPEVTVDVVQKFIQYYASHRMKQVRIHHDHTALQGRGTSRFRFIEIAVDALRAAGWEVIVNDLGRTANPAERYEFFSRLFRERINPQVTLNIQGCEKLITSMRLCQVKEGKTGIEKNKGGEGKGPPDEEVMQPHLSDAFDTLVLGCMGYGQQVSSLPFASLYV